MVLSIKDLPESLIDPSSECTCSDEEFPSKESPPRLVRTIRDAMTRKSASLYRRSSTASSTAPTSSSLLCEEDEHNDKQQQQQTCCVQESERSVVYREVLSSTPSTTQEEGFLQHDMHEEARGDLLPLVLNAVHNRKWNQVLSLLEQEPSLAKRTVIMVIQGENSSALLVHLLCGIKETPVSVVDALVTTLHPKSFLQNDERAGRLPIHIAVVRDAFLEMVLYLCQASSGATSSRSRRKSSTALRGDARISRSSSSASHSLS